MKREDTLKIENVLLASCFGSNPKLAEEYGCTEVTIDFQRNGNGKEIVDFISYNPKAEEFRCYEIKVTMADFHSKAKKSWYGDFNYLVVSKKLYHEQSKEEWKNELPDGIGLIVVDIDTMTKETIIRPKYQAIQMATTNMLKDSIIRSLFYQNQK